MFYFSPPGSPLVIILFFGNVDDDWQVELHECSDSSNEDEAGDCATTRGGGNIDDMDEAEAGGWTTAADRVNEFYDGDVETSDPQLAREVASSILFRISS